MKATLYFFCRACKTEYLTTYEDVGEFPSLTAFVYEEMRKTNDPRGMLGKMLEVHQCPDGRMGVGDLIAVKREEN